MTIKKPIFLLILFSLSACSTPDKELPKVKIKISLANILSGNEEITPFFHSLQKEDQRKIIQLYQATNYTPLFHTAQNQLTDNGKLVAQVVNDALYYGIPQSRITSPHLLSDSLPDFIKSYVDDIELTVGILRLIDDITYGFSDSLKTEFRQTTIASSSHITSIQKLSSAEELTGFFQQFKPKNEHYHLLANELKNYLDNCSRDLILHEIPLSEKDSVNSYANALKNLQLLGHSYAPDENTKEIIKNYQRKVGLSPDGVIGQATKHELESSPIEKAYHIAWEMERTRYAITYPKQYLKVNIPEFKVYYFNEDTIASVHNVVVGKFEHQTKLITSKVHRLVTYPYWNVPFSIATDEILPAVKANINYLARNRMEVLQGEKVIDPHTINWKKLNKKNFPYRIRQLPGPKNSLGILKFEFYNPYDIYLHDTPNKELLNTSNRMYSHGCVRTQYPIDLAKKMLEINEKHIDKNYTPDSLDAILAREEQLFIRFKRYIPIYTEYHTVAITPTVTKTHKDKPDEYENQVYYFRDIYLWNEEKIRYFFGVKKMR